VCAYVCACGVCIYACMYMLCLNKHKTTKR